ncbi:hypothetical protein ACFQ3T_23670, partial [Saccharothrix hoggarensis]
MTGTGQEPLIRLADELGHLGRRLEAVGLELHRVGSAQALATVPPPQAAPTQPAAPSTGHTQPAPTRPAPSQPAPTAEGEPATA